MALTDQEFRLRVDEALEEVRRDLLPLAEEHDFDIELQQGVLVVAFDEPREGRFVVSPNAPVHQVWVSAMSRGYKLPWSDTAQAFALDGDTLPQLVHRLVLQYLGS